jgi:hypothetical protein
MSLSVTLAAVWSVLLLIAYLKISYAKEGYLPLLRYGWLGVVILAILVRLVPNVILPMGAGYDIESYEIVGDLVLQGKDVYSSKSAINRHPYLPLQMYWMASARWLSAVTALPFVQLVRLVPILADACIALVLFRYLHLSVSPIAGLRGGLLYALNPIPVFVSAYHGQFDALPTLFLLLAALTITRSTVKSGVWLGLGVWIKSWPVLGLPVLWSQIKSWRKKLGFSLLIGIIPLFGVIVYLLIFPGNIWAVFSRALGYNWGIGVWGYSYLFHVVSLFVGFAKPFTWLVNNGRYVTLMLLAFIWLFKARKEMAFAGILTVLVGFFAVTHAFSIQYLMWLIPFAIVVEDEKWLRRYTLAAFAYMFLVYTTLILETHITNLLPWPQADWFVIIPSSLPAWLVTVGWLYSRVRE